MEQCVHWFKILSINDWQDTGKFMSTRRPWTCIQRFKFRQDTNKLVFRMSKGDCHPFSWHASGPPFISEGARAGDMFLPLNCGKTEARHRCWLVTTLFSEEGTNTPSACRYLLQHPTYNECSWILRNCTLILASEHWRQFFFESECAEQDLVTQ